MFCFVFIYFILFISNIQYQKYETKIVRLNSKSKHTHRQVLNPLDAVCDRKRNDAVCVSNLKNARKNDKGVLVERPDVKIFLPFRFFFYRVEELFRSNTYNRFLVAPGGDHLISLIDEISYVAPPSPMLSQMDDIPPEQFCNGDNRPPDCGLNCMCTHTVDIPLNAIVEVVLVDEGMSNCHNPNSNYIFFFFGFLSLSPLDPLVQQTNLSHPFHLHGTSFHVIGMGRSPDANIKKINLKHALDWDRKGLLHRQFGKPPLKDTIAVPNNGYVVLRFRADNPGKCAFLCFAFCVISNKIYTKQDFYRFFYICCFVVSNRFLAIPLSLFVPYFNRNESSCAYRDEV